MNERHTPSRAENFRKHGIPFLTTAAGALAVGAVFGVGEYTKNIDKCTPSIEKVTVQPGDTTWKIASEYIPNADPRDSIIDIVESNPGAYTADGDLEVWKTLNVEVCEPDIES